jgi:vesicle-fusing ATPase
MTPMFAVRDDELKALFHNGIVEHSKDFESVASRMQSCADQVRKSERTRVLPILIRGKFGSGKTAFSAWSAVQSGFPFKKRICAADMLGMGPGQKVAYIDSVFQEAYKTPLACIVLDDLERLVEYVPLGKSYNPHVLNSLLVLISKPPPDRTRRLLVLATTSNVSLMDVLGLRQNFMQEVELPMLQKESMLKFLDEETKIPKSQMMEIVGSIKRPIPVKIMLNIIEFSRQDVDGRDEDITCESFMACMAGVLGGSSSSAYEDDF